MDVPLPESSQPVLDDLRDESFAQGFEEVFVGQPDHQEKLPPLITYN